MAIASRIPEKWSSSVRMSKKGWVVIPKGMRERHGIRPGDEVRIIDLGSRLFIVKAARDPIKEGRGLLKGGPSLTEELLKERRWELEQEERDLPPPRPRP